MNVRSSSLDSSDSEYTEYDSENDGKDSESEEEELTPQPVKNSQNGNPSQSNASLPPSKHTPNTPKSVSSNVKKNSEENPNRKADHRSRRRWSEEDELVLLEGAVRYSEKTGINIANEIPLFHKAIKKQMGNYVSVDQMVLQLRKFRKKSRRGKLPSMTKHHKKVFSLSNKLWREDSNDDLRVLSNGRRNKWAFGETMAQSIEALNLMKESVAKKKMGDGLNVEELDLKLFLKWNLFLADCTKLVLSLCSEKQCHIEEKEAGI